jgi:hypothetical protein
MGIRWVPGIEEVLKLLLAFRRERLAVGMDGCAVGIRDCLRRLGCLGLLRWHAPEWRW